MARVGAVGKLCCVLQADCDAGVKEAARAVLRLHSGVWSGSPCVSAYLLQRRWQEAVVGGGGERWKHPAQESHPTLHLAQPICYARFWHSNGARLRATLRSVRAGLGERKMAPNTKLGSRERS
jgi:hypothetical protein